MRPASRDVLVCWHPDHDLADYTESRLFAAEPELESPTLPIHVQVASLFESPPTTA